MYSLRNLETEDDWLSKVLLLLRSHMFSTKICIIVEGKTDLSFFNMYRISDRFIYQSPENGKREVIESVRKLREAGNDAVYGVCDADFDCLCDNLYQNILYTEEHDLEMMLIKGGVVDKFIMGYTKNHLIMGNAANDFCEDIKGKVLFACYEIGILKWFSYLNRSMMNFKGLSYSNFISISDGDIDLDIYKLISEIRIRSPRINCNLSDAQIVNEMLRLKMANVDAFSICNGHDFTSILKMFYDTDISIKKNMTINELDGYLRSNYHINDFQKTKLHQNINDLISNH